MSPVEPCSWQLAAQRYEKGEQALQEAKRVEAEHEARLTDIHRQREQLWKREEKLLQVRAPFQKGGSGPGLAGVARDEQLLNSDPSRHTGAHQDQSSAEGNRAVETRSCSPICTSGGATHYARLDQI